MTETDSKTEADDIFKSRLRLVEWRGEDVQMGDGGDGGGYRWGIRGRSFYRNNKRAGANE